MTWPTRIGVGVAVLAALAAGRTVDAALPIAHTDERPFVHAAEVGEPVHVVYADVTVDAVHTAKAVDAGQRSVGTPGRWLIVDVTVVAWGRPLVTPGISLQDARGRTFQIDPRSGYSWESAPTGVPWQVQVPFDVPRDALEGATFVFSRSNHDDRRDDVARVDLGIDADDAKRLWDTTESMEVSPAQMARS
jgi:hypothetical protein